MHGVSASNEMTIVTVRPGTPLVQQVILLADRNTDYLGIYPRSCYDREAAKGRIVAAVTAAGDLAGYVLYWIARNRAKIQHCCVDERFRGQGVGRLLIGEMKRRTKQLLGIELHCAREFERSCRFWRSNDFVPIDEKPGRGHSARPLTRFVFDHRGSDLFTSQLDAFAEDRLLVVVDTNVVFDWQDDRETSLESRALLADWLASEIDLRVTDFVFADADRHPDAAGRRRRRQFLYGLGKINENREVAEGIRIQLEDCFGPAQSESSAVDMCHIAAAIAANADAFVTHDRDWLARADDIQERFGLLVCAPAVLIARLDENLRGDSYEPVRLSGSPVLMRKLSGDELAAVCGRFLNYGGGERRAALERRIRELVTDPVRCDVHLIEWPSNSVIGVLGVDRRDLEVMRVPLVRFRHSAVTPVLLRHAAAMLVKEAVVCSARLVVVTDEYLPDEAHLAFTAIGFRKIGATWTRCVPTGVHSRQTLAAWCESLNSGRYADLVTACRIEAMNSAAIEIEQRFWPVKLTGEALRCFIVPIQPEWAIHLFDEKLAMRGLYGGEPGLIFNTENVYYRSAKPKVLEAPGRVLWYVSDDGGCEGLGAIRACSPLLEVDVGSAKELYGKYRKLGVYDWRHLMAATAGDPRGQLMALRFGVSESFKRPVPRASIKEVLERHGRVMPPLSTAYELSEQCFEEIYQLGCSDATAVESAPPIDGVSSGATRAGHSGRSEAL
jgi:GNAT superfamily N-acetyltransferase